MDRKCAFSYQLDPTSMAVELYDKSWFEVNCSNYPVKVPILLIQGFQFVVNCDTTELVRVGVRVEVRVKPWYPSDFLAKCIENKV